MSDDGFKDSQESKEHGRLSVKKSTYNNMLKGLVAAIAIAAFVGGYTLGNFSPESNSMTKEDLAEIVKEINSKPAAQVVQQPTQPSAPTLVMVSLDDDPVLGSKDAPVTIVEFSDFQCPFCSRFYHDTLSQIEQNYIETGKVKIVYRDYPLSFHQNAKAAHIASECADEQNKFWSYHDVLFEKQTQWQSLAADAATQEFLAYAEELGLEKDSFESCLGSSQAEQEVTKDFTDGSRYGTTGTPTFFIGNEKDGFVKIVGAQPYATFASAIDSQLD
jgi:protein-disulfide isomerase